MNANLDYDKIYEIRLRVGRPLFYTYDGGEGFLTDHDGKYVVTREDLKETMVVIPFIPMKMKCARGFLLFREVIG